MKIRKQIATQTNDGFLNIILSRYLPYWPLFVLLCLSFLFLAFVATRYVAPVYKVNATLVINDKEKGVAESETVRSLNVYAANKIVENEIQVLKSRTNLHRVISALHLYAPIYSSGRVKPASAFLTSPIVIKAKDPLQIVPEKHIDFYYNENDKTVTVNGKQYGLGTWLNTKYGVLQFEKNPNQKIFTNREFFFSLVDAKIVADDMYKNLEVSASSKLSSVVTIEYTDQIPERGVTIVNTLLEMYTWESVFNNNQLATKTLEFLSDRVGLVENELDSIQRKIQQFKASANIVDLSEQGRLYLINVSDNDRKISEYNSQLAIMDQVNAYVSSGKNTTGIVPTALGINDPVLADILQKLNALELQHANLRTSAGENNPLTKSVLSEIQKIRPNIVDIVQRQRAELVAGRNTIAGTTNQYNAKLRTLPGKERELLEVTRQLAIKSDVYAFLLKRKEEAELSTASTISESRIVDKAQAGATPVASKKIIFLLAALILGTALSVTYIFLREGTGDKILFRSTIEKATNFPVIGEVFGLKKLLWKKSNLASNHLQRQFDQMHLSLGIYDHPIENRCFLVTSHVHGEGKSFVSRHLAESLANLGKKTILLDFSSQNNHPTAAQRGGIEQTMGKDLNNNFSGDMQASNVQNLYLSSPNLKKEHLEDIFESLRTTYDYVVIDTPPLEIDTTGYRLARNCGTMLLVVRHKQTPVSLLKQFEEKMSSTEGPTVKIVFNDVKPRGFLTSYFGYNFGYGYQTKYL